jgi:hypothetical protein
MADLNVWTIIRVFSSDPTQEPVRAFYEAAWWLVAQAMAHQMLDQIVVSLAIREFDDRAIELTLLWLLCS